jgi:hypothetical protein
VRSAGMAGGRPVALLLDGVRRRARRHQHELPLSHRRQTSFHASCRLTTTRQEMTTWTKPTPKRWHCTAGR